MYKCSVFRTRHGIYVLYILYMYRTGEQRIAQHKTYTRCVGSTQRVGLIGLIISVVQFSVLPASLLLRREDTVCLLPRVSD